MGVDAGNLWRRVGTQTQGATGKLVNQLEGLNVKRFTGAGQQRVEVFQQRGGHQFVAVHPRRIEQCAPKVFKVTRL
jgi:hypothetical protein